MNMNIIAVCVQDKFKTAANPCTKVPFLICDGSLLEITSILLVFTLLLPNRLSNMIIDHN